MSSNAYSGDAPISSLWVLDDGGQLRYFLSDRALATGLLYRYGESAADLYKMRPASLLHFSAQGIADCSAFINLPVPERSPNPNVHAEAFDEFRRGFKAAWNELIADGKRKHADDKKLLTAVLAEYRDAVHNGMPRPRVNPWGSTPARPTATTRKSQTR